MSSRNLPITVVALVVVGAGLWWTLSSRIQHEQSADTYRESNQVIEAAEPEPIFSNTPALEEGEDTDVISDDAPVLSASPEPVAWRALALAFAMQDDADPTLSRHLEAEMQKLMDTTLDRAKVDAQPVICRMHRCQVIAVDRTLAPDPNAVDPSNALAHRMNVVSGGPLGATISPILRGATSGEILNPYTGASLKAQLEKVQSVRTEPPGIEIIIAFAGP